MTEIHDWWSRLSPFEKSRLRFEERETERKEARLAELNAKRGWPRTKSKLHLEIAGHRFMRQALVNRGTQRAKLNISPSLTLRDRRMTHVNSDITRTA